MTKDHLLFVFATLLIAIHVVDGTIQAGESLFFYVGMFVLPIVIVALFWHKMKDIVKLSFAIIFFLLELNEVANVTVPAFVHEGVTNLTRNGFFIISALVAFLAVIGIVSVRVYKAEK